MPNDKFTGDYGDMWVACFNWVVTADKSKLASASDLHWLVRENSRLLAVGQLPRIHTALKGYWES